jgi:L-xylulokinase
VSGRLVVGLDVGSTATRAVVFDPGGGVVSAAHSPTPAAVARTSFHERSAAELWATARTTIARAVEGAPGRSVAGIAISGHGDGLLLLDDRMRPVGPMATSVDTRARPVLDRWRTNGALDAAGALGGAITFAGSSAPLLAWFAEHDAGSLARARWVVTAKDWLLYKLSGVLATDPTTAPGAFTDTVTHRYSPALAELFGMPEVLEMLPPIRDSAEVVGGLTREAAAATGLPVGTPAVTGLHDVAACLAGTVGVDLGRAVLVAGTFGIDIMALDRPTSGADVNCRPGPQPATWTIRRTSPAAGANLAWALRRLGSARLDGADDARVEEALSGPRPVQMPVFLPYLYGGAPGRPATGALLGLRGHHEPAVVLRAVLEGLAFTHRAETEVLASVHAPRSFHLTGGGVRSRAVRQLFADVLGRPVEIPRIRETAALGAAMCAAHGVGLHRSAAAASTAMRGPSDLVVPHAPAAERLDETYAAFQAAGAALLAIAGTGSAHTVPASAPSGSCA